MQSFRDLPRQYGSLPPGIVRQLSAIAAGQGRGSAARTSADRRRLESFRIAALVQSVATSNALEGVTAPASRVRKLVIADAEPRNRSEAEIAGYRYALGVVDTHALDLPFEPPIVEQLHGYLYRFTDVRHAGRFKRMDNTVRERDHDGTIRTRFEPLSAAKTPAAMDELHKAFAHEIEAGTYPYPLLCAAYVFDFTVIHPFTDGNGRMSRLITTWLLLLGGYDIGRYVSVEGIVAETGDSYYRALGRSTTGWHENRHDLRPWTEYLLGVLVAAYAQLSELTSEPSSRSGKRDAVERFVRGHPEFTVADIRRAAPDVSDHYISAILRRLRDGGEIERLGQGRGSRWRHVARG